jgi:hypothetical protein
MSGDKELLKKLRKLRRRIPRFSAVKWDRKKRAWHASIKFGSSVKSLGWYKDEVSAFRAYLMARAERPSRRDRFESPTRIARLLELAERCPARRRTRPGMPIGGLQ